MRACADLVYGKVNCDARSPCYKQNLLTVGTLGSPYVMMFCVCVCAYNPLHDFDSHLICIAEQ